MLLISHLNQDLCAATPEIFCVFSQFPSSTKSILQNPRGKTGACPRDTFRGIWSHRSRRCGGSPHVTDIIPVNILELGAVRRRQSQIPHWEEIKEIPIENGTPGVGGEESDPCPAWGCRNWESPGQAQIPDNDSEMSETKVGEVLHSSTHPLLFRCHSKPLPQQAPGTADFASS